MESLTFIKLPIYVLDEKDEYHLLDILLPSKCDEEKMLLIISFLSRIRIIMNNQKNITPILSEFLDNQPYMIFNFLLLKEDYDKVLIAKENLKKMKINNKVFSLSNQEHTDFYFNTILCITIMELYK